MRTIDFRYTLIRNGADYGTIKTFQGGEPTIRMSSQGEIKTSLSGSFRIPEKAYDLLSDQIRAEMIIDGTIHPLGIFLPSSVVQVDEGPDRHLQVEAFDRGWQVRDSRLENLLHIDSGTSYIQAIEGRLAESGIALVSTTESDAVLPEAREWNVGTSRLTIINELLSEINYNPLWFDANGVAVLEPVSVPNAENIRHRIRDDSLSSLLQPSMQRSVDVYSAPNVFIAVCSNPDKSGAMRAVSVNDNPQSPLSTVRRGRSISTVLQVKNIADAAELQAYADRARNDSLITGEQISLTTGLLPGYGVDDVVGLDCGDLFAIAIDRAWTMTLRTGGEMQHTLEKVVINLG